MTRVPATPMESTAFTPLNEQANTVLEPRQAQLKLSLSSSVAQPTPPSVARRSAQTNANHKRIKNKKKRDVEAVQRAPRSPQQHRHQTNKNNKTHKIKINKNKKFKRTRDVAAGATTRMLTRMRSLIFLLICTKNLLAHCTVAQTCPSGADCSTGSVSNGTCPKSRICVTVSVLSVGPWPTLASAGSRVLF